MPSASESATYRDGDVVQIGGVRRFLEDSAAVALGGVAADGGVGQRLGAVEVIDTAAI